MILCVLNLEWVCNINILSMLSDNTKIEQYKKLNASFKKVLIYHLGVDAGFFSEYNNMVLAILYCLENEINFKLYSKNANFSIDKGWSDYFEPFCEEVIDDFHDKYNYRYPLLSWKKIINETLKSRSIKFLKWKIKNQVINIFVSPYLKKKYKFDFYTFELFDVIRSYSLEKKINIPELDIDDKLQYACSKIIDLTWVYKNAIQERITMYIRSLNLSSTYVSLHIRGGDKYIESSIQPIGVYIDKLCALTQEHNVFLLTDDYSIVTEMQKKTEKNIYTLCLKSENGYFHLNFQNREKKEQKEQLIKLFASIEVMANSQLFIGTFSSNPGMYLGMRCPSKSYSVDFTNWLIW